MDSNLVHEVKGKKKKHFWSFFNKKKKKDNHYKIWLFFNLKYRRYIRYQDRDGYKKALSEPPADLA